MTNAPRFLKPKKLGLSTASWLKHDVLGTECTAKVCLYFFDALNDGDAAVSDSTFNDDAQVVVVVVVVGNSRLVLTAVSIIEGIFADVFVTT